MRMHKALKKSEKEALDSKLDKVSVNNPSEVFVKPEDSASNIQAAEPAPILNAKEPTEAESKTPLTTASPFSEELWP